MGRRSEFEEIAMVHLDAVYRAAFAICSGKDMVEDLVQTTFLKAFERFGSFKKGTNCKAWLLQILRYTWIDQLRRRKFIEQSLPFDEELIAGAPHSDEIVWSDARDLLENFSDEEVIRTLKELPDEQRLALFLIDVEQLSQEEVAKIMDVAVGTVKSRTSRARAALKEKLLFYAKEKGFGRSERWAT
jgi:RNA polymerase sigma-70 factor (ECF subfamily)